MSFVCPKAAASKTSGFDMPALDDMDEDDAEVDEAGVRVVGEIASGVKALPSSTPVPTGAEESREAGMDAGNRDNGIRERSKLSNISRLGKTS